MLNNLIKYSIRSFKRQRAYIIINILGLSIGITCSLLIALFVINEASYDKFNTKKDRIFRLILNGKIGGQEVTAAYTAAVIGPTMAKEFPEIEDFLRMTAEGPTIVEYNKQAFVEDHIVEADSSFFNFFSVPVIKGDPQNLLNAPRKVVLSESTAKRLFGDENPIDKPLKIGSDTVKYTVTGVMADIPENSHFEANIIFSFMTNPRSKDPTWMSNSFSTYLLLKPNSNYVRVDEKIPEMIIKYVGPEVQRFLGISISDFVAQGNKYRFYLQNLTDIHLDPAIQQEFKEASDPKYLMIFGSIASFGLFGLTSFTVEQRTKEIGVRKAMGSSVAGIYIVISKEVIILVSISALIAWPVIYYFASNWLENFYYRINLGAFSFVAGFTVALGIAILTISYRILRAARVNPAQSLKYE